MEPLKFGILSTASINRYGFIPIVEKVADADLVAVASRNDEGAARYAAKHGIPYAYGDYDSLLNSRGIDCVYIPLPAAMHAEWAIKALAAGKHVLCEKPVTVEAAEAEAIKKKVEETGLVFAEAMHYRYHPLARRIEELIASDEIGEVMHVSATFCVPLPPGKIQYKPELGGGALLDVGCYPVNFVRWIARSSAARVEKAWAFRSGSGMDLTTIAALRFDNGVVGRIHCSLIKLLPQTAVIRGTKGVIRVLLPFNPTTELGPLTVNLCRLTISNRSGTRVVRVSSNVSYYYQLDAFCRCVRLGEPPLTNIDEAIAGMKLIDAIMEKAGIRTGARGEARA